MRPTASGACIGTHSAVRSRAVGRGRCWGRLGGEARRAGSPHTWHCPRPLRHPPCHGLHPTDLHTHPKHTAMVWPVVGSEGQRSSDVREQSAWRVGLGRASIHQPRHAHSGAHTRCRSHTAASGSPHGKDSLEPRGCRPAGGTRGLAGGRDAGAVPAGGRRLWPAPVTHPATASLSHVVTGSRRRGTGPTSAPSNSIRRASSFALDPHRAPCRRPVWRTMASNLAARFPGPVPPAGLPILPIIPLRGDDRSGSSTGPRGYCRTWRGGADWRPPGQCSLGPDQWPPGAPRPSRSPPARPPAATSPRPSSVHRARACAWRPHHLHRRHIPVSWHQVRCG